jgi:undecaprenyl-diphosphatase
LNVLQALILGIVQGLTEFLPVSSSGHLVLVDALLGIEAPGVFLVIMLHLATLAAVMWVYRKRLIGLLVGALRLDPDSLRYAGLLALASVPAAAVGIGFLSVLEPIFDRPVVAAALLLVTGVAFWTLRWATARESHRQEIRVTDSIAVGFAQAFALLPGISRSGSTVAAGAALGIEPGRIAEFSFLMSVPAIVAAALFQLEDVAGAGAAIGVLPIAVAFLAALVSGVLAIRLFVSMLTRQTFHRFAYYCWTVGTLYLAAAWLNPGLR